MASKGLYQLSSLVIMLVSLEQTKAGETFRIPFTHQLLSKLNAFESACYNACRVGKVDCYYP